MLITQKKQYALRAIFELAKHQGEGPLKSVEIAQSQAIPQRFLEIILNRLKHAGIVAAKRGYTGGFHLKRPAHEITVSDVFQATDDDGAESVVCVSCVSKNDCPFFGNCAFMPLWSQMQQAIDLVCDKTTVQDLLDSEAAVSQKPA